MGYRLEGPPLQHAKGFNIVSDAILPGSIQVPGSGRPIVLLRDAQTTGGYPKIATILSSDLGRFAQLRPMSKVRFRAVDPDDAQLLRREFISSRPCDRAACPARLKRLRDELGPCGLLGALAGAGAVSGLLAGVFGVGGGAIVVTVLYQAFLYAGTPDDLCMRMALGTAFAIMVPTSAASFLGHLKRGSADRRVARAWALPVAAGVCVGSLIASRLDSGPLKLIFVVLVLANAIKLLTGWPAWRAASDEPSERAIRISGVVIGLLSVA